MCMVLYLGSDAALPTSEWAAERPACTVGAPRPSERVVRRHFAKAHVRYLGSHTGCGCGFGFGFGVAEGDPVEGDAAEAASRRWLAELVGGLVEAEGEVELYACWSGDEALDAVERTRLQPGDLLDVEAVREGTFAVVSAAGRDGAQPA